MVGTTKKRKGGREASEGAAHPRDGGSEGRQMSTEGKKKNKRKRDVNKKEDGTGENREDKKDRKRQSLTPWSKSKKKRMRKLLSKNLPSEGDIEKGEVRMPKKINKNPPIVVAPINTGGDGIDAKGAVEVPASAEIEGPGTSALQQKFLSRLSGSRFRVLNEELYTTESSSAFEKFSKNPELFDAYHKGFRAQVERWPVNPIDVMLKWTIKSERKWRRDTFGSAVAKGENDVEKFVVADFGCGEAMLARELLKARLGENRDEVSVKEKKSKTQKDTPETVTGHSVYGCPFMVHSFDLVSSGNDLVTPCDMANVPLPDGSVDAAIFCLALMGTNVADFIREAHRVLKQDGILKIAEVRSRFETINHKDDDDEVNNVPPRKKQKKEKKEKKMGKRTDDSSLIEFLDNMETLGFRCTKKDRSNTMFVLMEFIRSGNEPDAEAEVLVKPCIYKRR